MAPVVKNKILVDTLNGPTSDDKELTRPWSLRWMSRFSNKGSKGFSYCILRRITCRIRGQIVAKKAELPQSNKSLFKTVHRLQQFTTTLYSVVY